MFHVVQFEEESGSQIEVVADTWLKIDNDGNYTCWWPRKIKSADHIVGLIKKRVPPNFETWICYPCKLHAAKDTYLRANKKVQKIITSDCTISEAMLTSDDEIMRKSRANRKKKHVDFDSDFDEQIGGKFHTGNSQSYNVRNKNSLIKLSNVTSPLRRSPRKKLDLDLTSVERDHQTSNESSAVVASVATPPLAYKPQPLSPASPHIHAVKSNVLTEAAFRTYYQTMITQINKLKDSIDDLKEEVTYVRHAQSGSAVYIHDQPAWTLQWPLNTLEAFHAQETILGEPGNFQKTVHWLSVKRSGKNWGKMTRSLLASMLAVPLQQKFVFSGVCGENMIKFEKTQSYKLIKEFVSASHVTVSNDDVRACIQKWIQHKSDRMKACSSSITSQ